jgi:hypothetical protein
MLTCKIKIGTFGKVLVNYMLSNDYNKKLTVLIHNKAYKVLFSYL